MAKDKTVTALVIYEALAFFGLVLCWQLPNILIEPVDPLLMYYYGTILGATTGIMGMVTVLLYLDAKKKTEAKP